MCFDSSISLYSLNNSWQTAQKVFLLSKFSVSYLVFEVGNRIGWCYVYWLRSVTLPAIMFPFETAKFFFASLNQDYSILCWVSTLGGGGGGGWVVRWGGLALSVLAFSLDLSWFVPCLSVELGVENNFVRFDPGQICCFIAQLVGHWLAL